MLREDPLDEGELLCEGPLDEGNYVARVFDDFRNRIRKRNGMSVLVKVQSIGLFKKYV